MPESLPRLSYGDCRRTLTERLNESAPSRLQLLCGPRQVGKTTLLLELAGSLGEAALYSAADGPEASLPGYWERLWERAEEVARRRGRAVLFLDDVHLLQGWAARLKGEFDRIRRHKLPIHIVATGSSSLRLAAGSRESLAGRFERLILPHWSARDLTDAFGLGLHDAAQKYVLSGGYPGSVGLLDDPRRWIAYVRDSIVEPAIGRDILSLAPVRRPALLRQVFGLCASSPARVLSLQKMQGQLQESGALETIAHYLRLLEDAFLVAALSKFSRSPGRRRASPPKVVVLNNALLAACDPRGSPNPRVEPDRFGAWLENACLASVWNSGQELSYWREEPWEVDGVMDGDRGAWAVEVKSGAVERRDLTGLLEFTGRHPRFKPLLIATERGRIVASRAGIDWIDWREFLVSGPPRR